MAPLTMFLGAAAAATAAAELFALDSGAQLWKVGAEPGEGVTYTKLGPKHPGSVLSISTCIDSKRGVFYYVGGSSNSDCNLYGVSTADGSQTSEQKLPDADDRGSLPMMWQLACDEKAGTIFALGDYDLPPPSGSMWNFPPEANRTIWRFDAAAKKLDGIGALPAYAYQIHQDSGTMSAYHGAVNTNDGQLSLIDNRRDAESYGVFPGLALFLYDTTSGKEINVREIGFEGGGTPSVQVFDSKLNRFFGMCTSTVGVGQLNVPFSCWWTATKEPQLMQQLSDYSEASTSISSVDVNGRVAFFMLQDKLSSVSLDTGKIISQLGVRTDRLDMYQHQSTAEETTYIVL